MVGALASARVLATMLAMGLVLGLVPVPMPGLVAPSLAAARLEPYNGGFFTIQKPRGWEVHTAGYGSTLGVVLRDPASPLRQEFTFGLIGPFYQSEQQRQIDHWYMRNSGFPIPWIEMPVVDPLTPASFLARFHDMAVSPVGRGYMPQIPRLQGIQVISVEPQPSPVQGGQTALIRAVFAENGVVAEGLFMVTVVPYIPFMNGPGGGVAVGLFFTGVTAPKKEFKAWQPVLVESIRSFNISQAYVDEVLRTQKDAWTGVVRAGETLRAASDSFNKSWNARRKADDILSEKRSDATLGKERLYDPGTGEVFEFDNGFYDQYNLRRNAFNRSNLQPLPDDAYDLWMRATLNGYAHVK